MPIWYQPQGWFVVGDEPTTNQVAVGTALSTATTSSWFSGSWITAATTATTAATTAYAWPLQPGLAQQAAQYQTMQAYNQQQDQWAARQAQPPLQRPAAPAIIRSRPSLTDDSKERAQALLLEHLTPEQRRTLDEHKWFIVEGGRSKTKYRIQAERGLAGNVDVIVNDRVTHRLCAHCAPNAIPMGDHLLAQKVMLELAEDEFLRIANRHGA